MEFAPAGEIIGLDHQVRTVRLAESPQLPDGDYTFVDMYCIDATCDCRKTMIKVLLNGAHVSTINFGWESPAYYREWMGIKREDEDMPQMAGASIDMSSPNKVSPEGMLSFFNALLDEHWITVFKHNYSAVKARLAAYTETQEE